MPNHQVELFERHTDNPILTAAGDWTYPVIAFLIQEPLYCRMVVLCFCAAWKTAGTLAFMRGPLPQRRRSLGDRISTDDAGRTRTFSEELWESRSAHHLRSGIESIAVVYTRTRAMAQAYRWRSPQISAISSVMA